MMEKRPFRCPVPLVMEPLIDPQYPLPKLMEHTRNIPSDSKVCPLFL